MKIALILCTGVLWCAAACAVAPSVQAAQDIVSSARYYKRPGSKGTSHYQLYRINADGSKRRQITTGARDNLYPQWSPDGKKILYVRRDEEKSLDTLSLINANGSAVKTVRTFSTTSLDYYRWSACGDVIAVACLYSKPPDTRLLPVVVLLDHNGKTIRILRDAYGFVWSKDGSKILVPTDKEGRIYEGAKSSRLTVRLSSATWLDNQTLVGIAARHDDGAENEKPWNKLQVLGANGNLRKTVPFKHWSEWELDETNPYPAFLAPRPASQRTFTIAYDTSDSTVRPNYIFALADSQSGQLKWLAQGQFLEWAPDGQKFCTAPGQDLTVYDKQRKVWTAPLRIGSGTSGKFKNIVSGLVHVVAADWRGSSR